MGNGKASNPSWHKWRRNRSTSDTKPSYARPISRRKPWLFFSRCSWEKDLATIRGTDICGRPLSPYQFVRRFSSVERKGMREEEIENAKCRVEECRNHPRVDSKSTLRIQGRSSFRPRSSRRYSLFVPDAFRNPPAHQRVLKAGEAR